MFDTYDKREMKNHPEQPKEYPELGTADMAFATLHIAYEHGPSSRTTVALWATGSHEAKRSQEKLAGVALSIQGRIVEPSAKVTMLRLCCSGQPLQLAVRRIMNHAFPSRHENRPELHVSQCGTVNFGLLLPFAHGSQKPEEAVRMKVPTSQG